MKQNITADEWGEFERNNRESAQKLRDYYSKWQMRNQEENYPNQFVTIQYEPIFIWLTIGRMIEFLEDKIHIADITREDPYAYLKTKSQIKTGWFVRVDSLGNRKTFNKPELCDALWKAVKEVLKENNDPKN